MKDLAIQFSQTFLTWIALAVGCGVAIRFFFEKKSFGKAAVAFVAGCVIAFCCYQPETVLNKVFDGANWALNLIHFG